MTFNVPDKHCSLLWSLWCKNVKWLSGFRTHYCPPLWMFTCSSSAQLIKQEYVCVCVCVCTPYLSVETIKLSVHYQCCEPLPLHDNTRNSACTSCLIHCSYHTSQTSHDQLLLPVSQVTKLGKKHVGDGAEVLFCFILTELHEDQLSVSDIGRAANHQSSFLWKWSWQLESSFLTN